MLVCQGRAAAHGRLAPGVFSDPVAIELLHPDECAVVEQVRAGTPPEGFAARVAYESVLACADVVVPRTVAIDEAIRAAAHPQLVILGAGLDTRSWRMTELADTDVTEIDHPASQRDKRERGGDRRTLARTHRFQPADLAVDDLGEALESAGHDPDAPTTWVWEGVIPYLQRADVGRTLAAIEARSLRGSILIANYQTPSLRARSGRIAAALFARAGGAQTITAGEPWRTLIRPSQWAHLLADAGFGVRSDEDLATVAQRIGFVSPRTVSLGNGRVAVAVRH